MSANDSAVKCSAALGEIGEFIDERLKQAAGHHVGFTLFVWSAPRPVYTSNALRSHVIAGLEKFIRQWKAGRRDIPLHELERKDLAGEMIEPPPEPTALDLRMGSVLRSQANETLEIAATMLDVLLVGKPDVDRQEMIDAIRGLKK